MARACRSRALAPVAGTVTQVLVKAGDAVTEGQPLLAIEAMKMEMWLNAQARGVIKAVHAKAGDQVLVHPGAILPADGKILEGQSSIDESLLTGEYLPQARTTGDAVTAGTLNVEGALTVEVQALGQDTRLSAIVRLLDRAQAEKPRLAEIADRAAQWFLLLSLIAAAAIGLLWWELDASRAFWIVLAMLVATCPCAPRSCRPVR